MQTLHSNALSPEQLRWPEHMARALAIAGSVLTAAPNPRVGCVLVADLAGPNDEQIAEGWHKGAGLPHAEPEALAQVQGEAKGATAFVTLEPCCHTGQTGPCSTALIAAGIQQLVIASRDPNPKVSGGGIAELEAAGVAVFFLAEFEAEARALNRGFFSRMERGRPFVRCKLAMSLDGRTALANGESQWITGVEARADVQAWRASSDVILTGIGTVEADDCALTLRPCANRLDADDWERAMARPTPRAVVDTNARTKSTARVLHGDAQTTVFTAPGAALPLDVPKSVSQQVVATTDSGLDLQQLLMWLGEQGANEILVEAGATLVGSLEQAGLIDQWLIYVAPVMLGADARPAHRATFASLEQANRYSIISHDLIGDDVRITMRQKINA